MDDFRWLLSEVAKVGQLLPGLDAVLPVSGDIIHASLSEMILSWVRLKRGVYCPGEFSSRDYIQRRRHAEAGKADACDVKMRHNVELCARDEEIRDLRRENAELRRRIDSSPSWAPGGSGESSTATGG